MNCVRQGCKNGAIKGATVCRVHGGNAPQVRAKAAVRAELMSWKLGDAVDDPAQTLLRLITQSRIRADMLAAEQDRLIADEPSLRDALVGDTWVSSDSGSYKAGEYIRGLAQLEAQERDRCARFCQLAIQAGLAERMVRATEKQVDLVWKAMVAGLEEAVLDTEVRKAVMAGVGRHLRAVSA